jgi:4-amino-4-deoxy-L-arabinose transferase-like glycosyltransferase
MRADAQLRPLLYLIGALLTLRAIVGVVLPLSFDEAYYWRWSQHLAAGYWDHPPLVAYVIRLGTLIFGDTEIGVRFVPILLSLAATWAVWRTGAILIGSAWYGALAALLYNATLIVGAEALVATPDAPSMAASAFFLYALAKFQETGKGAWWLAAGVAGGFALLAKYTALFLGVGALLWLLLVPRERRWLATPWPYLGAVIGILMFTPVIWWNAAHDWISFSRQFGRVGDGNALTLRFLGEFLAVQGLLATPFLGLLGLCALLRTAIMRTSREGPLALPFAIVVPALLYFLQHALHDRVQGNWPSFLYPAFAVLAAAAWFWITRGWGGQGWRGKALRFSAAATLPVALLLSMAAYAQALFGLIHIEGTRDPSARLLAVGYEPVARQADILRELMGASAIVTTSYAQTGWMSFYLPSRAPVIQANERERWLAEPPPTAEQLAGPLLYIAEERRDLSAGFAGKFMRVEQIGEFERYNGASLVEIYNVYVLEGPTAPLF